MKIAQLIAPGRLAGAETHVLELSRSLQQRDCEVILLCSSKQDFMFDAAKQYDVRAIPVFMGNSPLKNPLAALQLIRVLRREKVDVIATHLHKAARWGGVVGKIARIPVVSTVHAPRDADHHYERSQAVIAVSQAVRQAVIARGIDPQLIKVVYNGIDAARFSPSSAEDAKKHLDLPSDAIVLGIAAHLSPHKGHDWALEALAPLFEAVPQLHWLFVGDGPQRQALEEIVARLRLEERVHFAGFQRDVVPYFAAIDIMVLPSTLAEGFALVLAEAGAMGKPVITCDSGGSLEVVVPDETGFVVPPRDAAALRSAVETLVSDSALRHRLGSQGKLRVLEMFTRDRMTEATLAIYRGLINP